MRAARTLGAVALLATALAACRFGPGPSSVGEGDASADFEHVFGSSAPAGVEIVESVVFEYDPRISANTSDDWEIALIAPPSWIEHTIEDWRLSPVDAAHVGYREPVSDWYAPGPLESYDCYAMRLTSIPYVHMLVEREPRPDGRRRVYMSKH